MFHCIYGLHCHPDITRFEIEDGLLRHCAASLLSEGTTISSIVLDMGLHPISSLANNEDSQPIAAFNSLIEITADTKEATSPANLTELLAETALVGPSFLVAPSNIGELAKSWIGTATPGPKITAYFNSQAKKSETYRTDIDELALSVCNRLGDAGCRVNQALDDDAPFTTAISFWFSNPRAGEDAVTSEGFSDLMESALIDQSSLTFLESIEHRVVPNPNTWTTTTGVEPPPS